MEFSNTTNKNGIIQQCETLLGMADGTISGDPTLLKQFTGLINGWYRRVNSWIWHTTGTWEYDDSNYTDLPIATTDLVIGRKDYEIPSTAQKIERVEVLDVNGNYQRISQIDKSQIKTMALSEFYETDAMPEYYDLMGRSIMLYPAPGTGYVTTAKGLKIYFTRDIDEFASTDDTKEPGFVNNFHQILPLGASLDYCIGYLPDDVNKMSNIRAEINALKKELEDFYGSRNRDMKTRFSPKRRSYK